MKHLVAHSLKMHKIQTASVVVSIALSVMLITTFGLVYGGVQQGIETSKARGGADVMAVPTDAMQYIDETELLYTGAPAPVYMDESIVDEIESVNDDIRVSPQFYGQTLDSGCCSTTGETRLIGIDPNTDFVVSALASEKAIASLDGDSVIVGSAVGGVANDTLTIRGTKYCVVATMAETGTGFDSSIVADIDLVRDISRNLEGYGHYWEKNGDPATLVSCVMVDVPDKDSSTLTAVKARISLSGEATPLIRSEIADKSTAQLQSAFFLLLISAAIMAAITLLQLFARFYSSVWDRKKELALYRAIGASKSDLRKLIVLEIEALVVAGLICGIVLGFAAQSVLLGVMQEGLAFPYVPLDAIESAAIVMATIAAIEVVSLLSVIAPLRQIERLDPSAAMQQGDID